MNNQDKLNQDSLYNEIPKVVFDKDQIETIFDFEDDIEFCFDESDFEVRFF